VVSSLIGVALNNLASKQCFAQPKSIAIDQTIVQTTTVINPKLLSFFVEEFMIPEKDVKKMIFMISPAMDFGDKDIARTYPGGRYYVVAPSSKAQKS